MSDKEHDKVMAFDTLFTNNHIRMLKIIMPYFEYAIQKKMAIYIKFLELQYTMNYFKSRPYSIKNCIPEPEKFDLQKMCRDIIPYCSPNEKKQMEQMSQMFDTFHNYQDMMETVNMMKDMFPGDAPFGFGDGENMDFSQMADMMQMFNMFGKSDSDKPQGGNT